MVPNEETIDAGLKAVSDPTRRGILGLLVGRELSVLEIAEEFPMSRPAISKHLRILKDAGLVVETPLGRQRLYALEPAPLGVLSTWFARFGGRSGSARSNDGRKALQASRVGSERNVRTLDDTGDWRVW